MKVRVTRLATRKPDRLMVGEVIDAHFHEPPEVNKCVIFYSNDNAPFLYTTAVQEVSGQCFLTRNSVYRWEVV